MKFKLVMLATAYLVFYVQPAYSGDIMNMKSSAINTAQEIVSRVPNIIKAKGAAVVRAAADMASVLATGAGLEVNALGTASSSIKHAVSDGLYAIGETIKKAGNTITGDYPNYNGQVFDFRVRPPYAVRCFIDPCHQEGGEFNVLPPAYQRQGPSVWTLLREAAAKRMYGGRFVNIRHGLRRLPFGYRIIHSPHIYRGPMGTFRIQKK